MRVPICDAITNAHSYRSVSCGHLGFALDSRSAAMYGASWHRRGRRILRDDPHRKWRLWLAFRTFVAEQPAPAQHNPGARTCRRRGARTGSCARPGSQVPRRRRARQPPEGSARTGDHHRSTCWKHARAIVQPSRSSPLRGIVRRHRQRELWLDLARHCCTRPWLRSRAASAPCLSVAASEQAAR
jgi:hypothetical protein